MAGLSAEPSFNLSSGTWILATGVAAILTYVVSSVLAWRRLRQFNGPFSGSFSYLWIIRASFSGRMAQRFAEAETRFGSGSSSTVRIGPNELLTSDPDVIRRTSAARSKYTRSSWYKMSTIDPYDDAMLSTLDTATHDRIKAQTAPGYAGKDNPGLEGEINFVLAQMVDKIRSKYATARSGDEKAKKPLLDFASMVQYFTLDSISKVSFGEECPSNPSSLRPLSAVSGAIGSIGLVREERDIHGHIQMLNDVAPAMVVVAAVPYLRAIVGSNLVLKLAGPKPEDKRGIGRLMGTGKSIVQRRFDADGKDQNDMLASFIRHGLTQRQCETEALVQIIAGSDTTATTIRSTMLYLLSTPVAYRTLQAEIDAGVKSGRISNPVSNAEANELPYLQAVILEGLRIHPPFTGLPFKVVPPGGDTIDGKQVPAGTLIAPNFWATGRNTAVFGADADVYRPGRWLEAEGEERAEMRRVAELVFGYGRWGCAGKMIAFLELNKVFVELLRHFDFQLVYPTQPWKSVNFNLFLQCDMWVAVAVREAAEGEG